MSDFPITRKSVAERVLLTEQKQLMKTVPTESPSSDFWLRQNLISFLKASMSKTMCKTDTTPVNTSLRTHGFVS